MYQTLNGKENFKFQSCYIRKHNATNGPFSKSHVDINKSLVNIIVLHIDIIYLAGRNVGGKKMKYEKNKNAIFNVIYYNVRQKKKVVFSS